jgi:DNA-3-methyladenine glycosylase I
LSQTYCDFAADHPVHQHYHDHEYGFPTTDEAVLLERLALEIFQAGLSWEIILKKRQGIFEAFEGFDVDTVAAYGQLDTERLLGNPGIIRNKLKVASIIDNAGRIIAMRDEFGGFSGWLMHNHPLNRQDWTKLFKKTFRFTGGEIVNEFLMSTGYLPGTHATSCPVFKKIIDQNPPWNQVDKSVFST